MGENFKKDMTINIVYNYFIILKNILMYKSISKDTYKIFYSCVPIRTIALKYFTPKVFITKLSLLLKLSHKISYM